MELWQLKTFAEVAKTLNFTRASRKLNLSQSAVSHQIKSLEQELGQQLFIRDKSRVSLSSEGRLVLDYAEKILGQVELMKREISRDQECLEGTITLIGTTRSLASPFPKVREAFRKLYKDIELNFESAADTKVLLEKVAKGEADLGFIIRDYDLKGLLAIPFGVFELIFVIGRNHRLSKKRKAALDELKDDEWILFDRDSWMRKTTDEIFSAHAFNPPNIYESNDGAVIKTLVKNGTGISILPAWGISDELESGDLIRLRVDKVAPRMPISIVVAEKRRSKLVTVFLNYLLEHPLEGISRKKISSRIS